MTLKNKFVCQSDKGTIEVSRNRDWAGDVGIRVRPRNGDEVEYELSKKQTRRLIRRLQESLL